MIFKKMFIAVVIDFIFTNICFGNVIEANPGDNLALNVKLNSHIMNLKNYDVAITYVSQTDFSISTYTIPLKHVYADRFINCENCLTIEVPEKIKSGLYEVATYLIEYNQNKKKYYKVNSDIERLIIKESSFLNRPHLLKTDLDKSRVVLSKDALNITLDILSPKNGFSKLYDVEVTIKDLKNNILLVKNSIIESSSKFGSMKIPISFENMTEFKSDSYKISVKLKTTKGLVGLLNSLFYSTEAHDSTFDLGEIHILNIRTKNKFEKEFHIAEFGAHPNDNIDDTMAISRAIAALKLFDGGTLIFEPGTYIHSDIINIQNISNFDIKGQNTRLVAINSERSAIIFKACTNFSFSGFQLLSPKNGTRRQEYESTGLSVLNSEKFTISNNLIYQSAAAGMMIARSSKYYKIHGNTILNTNADAIHNTGAAAYGAIFDNITMGNGDDGIAVVGYINSMGDTHHIKIFNNNILGNYHGRGIAVVGGSYISIVNNQIQDTSFAGILVASEIYYNTYGNKEILISNNGIINACQNDNNTHPSILIYGRKNENPEISLSTENILAKRNYIKSPKCNGLFRLGPNINDVSLHKNTLNTESTVLPIILNNTEFSSFTLVNNLFN